MDLEITIRRRWATSLDARHRRRRAASERATALALFLAEPGRPSGPIARGTGAGAKTVAVLFVDIVEASLEWRKDDAGGVVCASSTNMAAQSSPAAPIKYIGGLSSPSLACHLGALTTPGTRCAPAAAGRPEGVERQRAARRAKLSVADLNAGRFERSRRRSGPFFHGDHDTVNIVIGFECDPQPANALKVANSVIWPERRHSSNRDDARRLNRRADTPGTFRHDRTLRLRPTSRSAVDGSGVGYQAIAAATGEFCAGWCAKTHHGERLFRLYGAWCRNLNARYGPAVIPSAARDLSRRLKGPSLRSG